MVSSLATPRTPSVLIRLALAAVLTLLLSGWTCAALFVSCPQAPPMGQITSLSPSAITGDANATPLTVEGEGFTPKSQIMWNGSRLATTFVDSHHVQTMITQQIFEEFGGSRGSSVRIAVSSSRTVADDVCTKGGNSAAVSLAIE